MTFFIYYFGGYYLIMVIFSFISIVALAIKQKIRIKKWHVVVFVSLAPVLNLIIGMCCFFSLFKPLGMELKLNELANEN